MRPSKHLQHIEVCVEAQRRGALAATYGHSRLLFPTAALTISRLATGGVYMIRTSGGMGSQLFPDPGLDHQQLEAWTGGALEDFESPIISHEALDSEAPKRSHQF